MSDTDEPKFLNTREVCAYLRLKERTVYELVRTRQIPTMRVAGKWLFPKALIDRWLEENTDASPLAAKGAVTPAIVAGSHDPLLDWAVRESGCGLALLCQGSEDGLRRIDERSAMLAAVHLLDPATGEYNVAEFERLAHRGSLVLTEWARRRQGLVLAPGLGARVATIADLVRGGLRIVQRQEGSGSRRLFDHLLAGCRCRCGGASGRRRVRAQRDRGGGGDRRGQGRCRSGDRERGPRASARLHAAAG